ncbi:TRADD-N-associated membrane domain-containing protein [Streptomyces bohaiensis]|uniref:Cyanobacterial TRADD-N associated 2 transmembrane domain-containing protein n=1 Tax=Streptomyces bohaiensis TaxID=1431344 RepID=A0ABX1CFQ4_9ACTN|nr:hypothetical protein [Streptomyces bohaiensis]NJQ16044.1 hypothetical protein [Streptomyces bohaiensis]
MIATGTLGMLAVLIGVADLVAQTGGVATRTLAETTALFSTMVGLALFSATVCVATAARRRSIAQLEARRREMREAEERLEREMRPRPPVAVHGSVGHPYIVQQERLQAAASWPPTVAPPVRDDRPTVRVYGPERVDPTSEASQPGDAADETRQVKVPADDAGRPSGNSPLALAELWGVTHRRLDLYHSIALDQARTAFRNAQMAMAVGFLLLVVGGATAVTAPTTAGAVVAGSMGAVAAALAAFVNRAFVRSQEAAASQLRSYFDQPVEFSRYLAAERLVAEGDLTSAQRGEIMAALVGAVVAGPSPKPPRK